jgi:hypothetical protein
MNIPLKQKIRLWFDFLRLAHESTDLVLIENLKSSKNFYSPWGNFLNTSFTKWWAMNKSLFRNVSTLRRMTSSDFVDEGSMYLVIPFTYAPTTVSKIVQRMYAEEFSSRQLEKKKVKKVYGGTFGLSTEDFQVSQFAYYYRFAKDVYLPLNAKGEKVTTKQYVDVAKKVFSNQKLITSWNDKTLARRKVPFKDSSEIYANQSKRARDFVRIIENILTNVSIGVFPGDYLTVSVKTQSQKRRLSTNLSVNKIKRGVSQSRYIKKVVRDESFDPFRRKVKSS